MEYNVKHDEKQPSFRIRPKRLDGFCRVRPGGWSDGYISYPCSDTMEGMGVGSALMKYALDYARDHHYSVIPNCAFAQAFLLRHTNYRDLIS